MSVNIAVPEQIIDTSLVTSLLVFGARVLVKEIKAILGDLFQLLEFSIRWWIYIRNINKSISSLNPAPNAAAPAAE